MSNNVFEHLRKQGVSESLIGEVKVFRDRYPVAEELKERIVVPPVFYYGSEVLEMALAALLHGDNLLLSGAKATGKNILCETLAYIFGRPSYNISFHVNTDSATLIGTDTFRNNEVVLRKGSVYRCAEVGGFGVFDEINMAKNDAVSVLHATLDYRRSIDIPGYEKIDLHPATRFIGTMNYGYAGTKELNEALVSRFMVLDIPAQDMETIMFLLQENFPDAKEEALEQFAGLFMDLQEKAFNGEISTKPLDLRGLISSIGIMRSGLAPEKAIRMGIVNKSFDGFEKEIVSDTVLTRVPEGWMAKDVFG